MGQPRIRSTRTPTTLEPPTRPNSPIWRPDRCGRLPLCHRPSDDACPRVRGHPAGSPRGGRGPARHRQHLDSRRRSRSGPRPEVVGVRSRDTPRGEEADALCLGFGAPAGGLEVGGHETLTHRHAAGPGAAPNWGGPGTGRSRRNPSASACAQTPMTTPSSLGSFCSTGSSGPGTESFRRATTRPVLRSIFPG
jgi:hypothetical protein